MDLGGWPYTRSDLVLVVYTGCSAKVPPTIFQSTNFLYILWHLKKFWATLHGILYLENLRGATLAKHPVFHNLISLISLTSVHFWRRKIGGGVGLMCALRLGH